MESRKPVLSISLLVSGREDTTEQCLNSLQRLVKELGAELILVDTGCSETFRRKLEQYTKSILSFTWCNDFAKARNMGLRQATGEWFLYLDDDEWFEDVQPILDFFQSGEYREYEQAVYIARNYLKKDGSVYTDDWVSRMIRRTEETHFEGRVHESLVPVGGKCKKLGAFVHHYGYAFDNEEEERAHYQRNVSLLETLMKEEPDNIRWWVQIIPEYIGSRDGKKLQTIAEEALEKLKKIDKGFLNQCRGSFYSAMLRGLELDGRREEVLRRCEEYALDRRNTPETNCSLYSIAMGNAYELQAWESAARYGFAYIESLEQFQRIERTEQEAIIAESILLVKDAALPGKQVEVGMHLAEALLELHRENRFPEKQRSLLADYVRGQLASNGEFLNLPRLYWRLGEGGLLPLEELLLELPMEQWMVQVMVLKQRDSIEHWKLLGQKLQGIKTCEDERYQYFYSQMARTELEKMAVEVKKQIYALLEAGMQTEALGILRQLLTMLPEDEELQQLAEQLAVKC